MPIIRQQVGDECKVMLFPQVTALAPVLKIISDSFNIKFCSYTLLKAVMGATRDIKCKNMGPTSHARSLKWDFKENLVPAPCPELEQETIRLIPAM